MKELMKENSRDITQDIVKSDNIKITLEQWPCTVAILGICATYAFVSWINQSAMGKTEDD